MKRFTLFLVVLLSTTAFAQATGSHVPYGLYGLAQTDKIVTKSALGLDYDLDVRDYIDGLSGRPTYATWLADQANTDVTACLTAAVTAARAAGRALFLPGGTYLLSSAVNIYDLTVYGSGAAYTTVTQSGAAAAFTCGSYSVLEDIYVKGSASATIGIDVSGSSLARIMRCKITGFTNGIGIKAYASYRTMVDHLYVTTCAKGLLLDDNTTFEMFCSFINESTDAGTAANARAVATSGSDVEATFVGCYFESNNGTITIDASGSSNSYIALYSCGFEDNGGSTTNPINIKSGGPQLLVEKCSFGSPHGSITGYITDLYLAGSIADARSNTFVLAATNHVAWYAIGTQNAVTLQSNRYAGASLTTTEIMSLMVEDISAVPKVSITNDRVTATGGAVTNINKRAVATVTATDTSTSGTGEDDLKTYTLYKRKWGATGGARFLAAGTKTGANDTKTIKFYVGATGWTVHAAANDTNDWRLEVTVLNVDGYSQRVSWVCWNGTTVAQGYETASIDTIAADVTIKLTGECAHASDTITQTVWVVDVFN